MQLDQDLRGPSCFETPSGTSGQAAHVVCHLPNQLVYMRRLQRSSACARGTALKQCFHAVFSPVFASEFVGNRKDCGTPSTHQAQVKHPSHGRRSSRVWMRSSISRSSTADSVCMSESLAVFWYADGGGAITTTRNLPYRFPSESRCVEAAWRCHH